MSPMLRKSKTLDATGAPIDATALYTPINPHARGANEVYNPETTQLRGDHQAVLNAPHLWIRSDAATDEKGRALVAYRAAREAAEPTNPAAPTTRILGPIPLEQRRVALRNYHDKSGRIIHAGQVYDVKDPFVAANDGDMFGPEAA